MSDSFSHLLENYRNVRTLVLGANGFIGRWVGRLLAQAGSVLTLAVRNPMEAVEIFSAYQVYGHPYQIDLGDFRQVERLISDVKPAIIFNLAGYGVDPEECDEKLAYQINAELPSTICQILMDHRDVSWTGQAIVHAGTAAEYGRASGDLNEKTLPEPFLLYGMSKLKGTLQLKESCEALKLPGLTARLFTVYGPGEHAGRLFPSLQAVANSRKPLPLTSGFQKRDFTYVSEVAEGLLRLGLAEPLAGDWVNLATGKLNTIRDFVGVVAREYAIPRELLIFSAIPTREDEMHHDPVSVRRLKEWITWKPSMDIKAGVCDTRKFTQPGFRSACNILSQ